MRKTLLPLFYSMATLAALSLAGCGGGSKKTAAQDEEQPLLLYTCTADVLNVRAEPSASAQILGVVLEGEVCSVVPDSTSGDFYRIVYGTVEGFASKDYFVLAGEDAVATEIGYKGPADVDLAKTTSFIHGNFNQSEADKLSALSGDELAVFGPDWIAKKMELKGLNSEMYLAHAKTYGKNEQYRIESIVLVSKGYAAYEYMVTYDWRSFPVDCIQTGLNHTWHGDYGSSEIEGDTVVYNSGWGDETGSGTIVTKYRITPELKFDKVEEQRTEEVNEY